nr:hypothetical protein [Brevundimonas diminuta]
MTDPMELVGRLETFDGGYQKDAYALIDEAAACIREMVERGERSVDYEIWQDNALVAGSDNEADARHYAAVYEQDGPVELIKVVSFRSPLPPAPGAEDA